MQGGAIRDTGKILEEQGYAVTRTGGNLTFELPTATTTLKVSARTRKAGKCVVVLMKAKLDKVQFPTGNEETFEDLLRLSDDQCLAGFTYDTKDGFIYVVTKLISKDGCFPSEIILAGVASIERLAERYLSKRQTDGALLDNR